MKQRHKIGTMVFLVAVFVLSGMAWTALKSKPSPSSTATLYTYTVVHVYPHNQNAFTEGLVYDNGYLYESTGLYGSSSLRRVDLITGNVLQEVVLPSQFFTEGITVINDNIIQLTWREHLAFIYNKTSLKLLDNLTYSREGWGLAYDGSRLIMSDGSNNLYFLNPVTFQNMDHIQVHDGNVPVTNLNELEYIKGEVYANIWHQQKIAIINPQTGQVKTWIDLTSLQGSPALNSEQVLNGIAYDAGNDRLFVTGKDWPQLYEIRLVSST